MGEGGHGAGPLILCPLYGKPRRRLSHTAGSVRKECARLTLCLVQKDPDLALRIVKRRQVERGELGRGIAVRDDDALGSAFVHCHAIPLPGNNQKTNSPDGTWPAARPATHRSTPVRVQEGRHGAAHVCGVIGQPRSPHRRETSSVNGLRSAVTDASIASESLVRHRRLLGSRAMQDEGQLLLVPRAPRTKYPAEPPLVYLGRTPWVILSAMLLPHGPCIPAACAIQLNLVFSKPCTPPF